ncbi:hypothetical protein SDC9_104919 [bioreactor metagenome]|uniref:Uncharacterized protein n=1 Tax=bioreactor metagenome TaxID=1076179 RepID=A0A645AY42_9ZZZZ
MARVRLEEMDLPDPDEGTGLLRLVTECVDYLVDLQGKVLMGPYPKREHGVHGRLTGRSDDQGDVELVVPGFGDPVYFGIEPFDVVLLLLELCLGDEKREADLVVPGVIQLIADEAVDGAHYLPSVGGPDVHPLDRIALIGEPCLLDDVEIPFRIVLAVQWDHRLGLSASAMIGATDMWESSFSRVLQQSTPSRELPVSF